MLWPKREQEVNAQNLAGPKTLRGNLVGAGESGAARKVELQDMETLELIGQGAYGMVHKVQERATGQCRVLKTVVRPEGWNDNKLKLEAELLRQLDHPHILRIFAWYEDGDAINIVMEHCEGGELLKVVKKGRRQGLDISEKWLATAIRQTFEALVYLHSKGVLHKDLKGQNILLLHQASEENAARLFDKEPHVVVCDLGIAEVCCRGIFGMRGRRVAGTPCTMAPEVWKGTCSPRSDVWSMGCVMFELFANRLPFEVPQAVGQQLGAGFQAGNKQQEKWLELHRKGPDWKLMACGSQAKALCRQLLIFKETARPSASECLRHPWFGLCDEVKLTEKEVNLLCHSILMWRSRSPLQRALCLKLAVGSPCISRFARVFTKFDKDHSGILDRGEVIAALQHLGIDLSTAKKAAAALDVNGDNSCEYLEFVAACLFSLEAQFDELLRHEFRLLDRQSRGALTTRELEFLLEELRPIAESRGLQLTDLDSDSDGVISFVEFCGYFGRPGVSYSESFLQMETKKPAAMPMKQHIRIMNTNSSIEESLDQMRNSMDASSWRKAKPSEAQNSSAANKARLGGRGARSRESLGQVSERSETPSSCPQDGDFGGTKPARRRRDLLPPDTSNSPRRDLSRAASGCSRASTAEEPCSTMYSDFRGRNASFSRQSGSSDAMAAADSELATAPSDASPRQSEGKPQRRRREGDLLRARSNLSSKSRNSEEAGARPPARQGQEPPAKRGGPLLLECKDFAEPVKPPPASSAPAADGRTVRRPKRRPRPRSPRTGARKRRPSAEKEEPPRLQPHPSDISTAMGTSRGDASVLDSGIGESGLDSHLSALDDEAEEPADVPLLEEPGDAPAEQVSCEPPLGSECRDVAEEEEVREPEPHPCHFALSADNVNLITTSTFQSTAVSFDKTQACSDCGHLSALAWLQLYLAGDDVVDSGSPGRGGAPTGHCVVSL